MRIQHFINYFLNIYSEELDVEAPDDVLSGLETYRPFIVVYISA